MAASTINLIRPSSDGSLVSGNTTLQLRRIGWVLIGAFFVVSIAGLVTFGFVRTRLSAALRREATLMQQLGGMSSIEGLHTIVATRLGVISRVVDIQQNYDALFSIVDRIVTNEQIASVSYDEVTQFISLKLSPMALSQARVVVENLIALSAQGVIDRATLNTLSLETDGMVNMSLSFRPEN